MNSTAASIECSAQPLDLCFHPTRPSLLAAALVDGTVEVHDFEELIDSKPSLSAQNVGDDGEVDTIISSTPVHTQLLPSKTSESGTKQANCRAVLFAENGKSLYTGGTVGDLVSLDTEIVCSFSAKPSPKSILWRVPDASYHKSPIHVLHEIPAQESASSGLLVTGDDVGGVRVWDPRLMGNATGPNHSAPDLGRKPPGCVFSWKEHDDYISCFDHSSDGVTLLASSADCTLSVYDLRMAGRARQEHVDKEQIVRRSDDQGDELLSVKVIKNGKKVVCGTGEGVLAVWSWGTWGDISDRFPGHPSSLDSLLKFDEDTLLTGSSDGLIRVVSIHPDKLLGVLGDHGGFPIEKLKFNADRNYVGSVTHDNLIRLWDARILQDDSEDDEGNERSLKMTTSVIPDTSIMKTGRDSDDEWEDMDEDMEEDDDDSDDDSDGDESDNPGNNSSKKKGKLKTENEKFFEDLS